MKLNYSDTVIIGEHVVKMPLRPKDSEVFFINDKYEDACWDRERFVKQYRDIWFKFVPHHTKLFQPATLMEEDILSTLNKEDSEYIIATYEEEMRRRREGIFFRNGNDIIWLTGDHYFVLCWCKTKRPDKKGDYFDYRSFQRNFFYLVIHTEISEKILGLFISKPKKTGITNLMWLIFLNRATMSKNINLGNMNIDQDKGAKTFRDHFLYAYNGMVMSFKPQWKNKSEIDGKIIFGKQYNSSKKSRLFQTDSEDELNTTVMCVPTVAHAFDVDVFSFLWYDEPPKYKSDFGEIYRSNSAGTSIQDFIVGKIFLTSYTPDDNGLSFNSARDLFFDSELRTITNYSNGQTKSKLICYHIPAFESWATSIDKYGNCNQKEAIEKIQKDRDQLKDRPKELIGLTRQYANDIKEAWSVGGSGSVFDPMRIAELMTDIDEEERHSPETPYKEGRLEWEKPLWEVGLRNKRKMGEFCKVKFVELTDAEKEAGEEGRYRMYYDIPEADQNAALKNGRDEYEFLLPPARFKYFGGADPTGFAAASAIIQGSKNASFTINMSNEKLDTVSHGVVSKVAVSEFYHRDELPQVSYEDFLKEIIYFGKLVLVEGNAEYVCTRLMQEGLGHYMLVKDENGIITTWKPYMGLPQDTEKTYKFIKMTSNSAVNKELLETIIRLVKTYIHKPPKGEKDYGKTFKSRRTLEQLGDFDPTDTRKFDLAMALGYTLLCYETYLDMLLYDSETYSADNFASALEALAFED